MKSQATGSGKIQPACEQVAACMRLHAKGRNAREAVPSLSIPLLFTPQLPQLLPITPSMPMDHPSLPYLAIICNMRPE